MSFYKSYFIFLFFIISFTSFSQETFKNEAERIKYANKLFENQTEMNQSLENSIVDVLGENLTNDKMKIFFLVGILLEAI